MGQISNTAGSNIRNGPSSPQRQLLSVGLPAKTLPRLGAALKKQWRKYRKELKQCQEKFSPEAVHDSRVETRRLLSMVGLLSPFVGSGRAKKAQKVLKHHLDTFDALRDTQVQLQTVRKMKSDFPGATVFCDSLRKREKMLAHQTRKDVKNIKTKRLSKLITGFRQDTKSQAQKGPPEAANVLLLRMLESAFVRAQRLRDKIDPETPKTIHCTRIAFKKFRYMLEILSTRVQPLDKKLLQAMHSYQTMMGDIQDAEVLLQAWHKFWDKKTIIPKSERAFGNELLHRRKRLIGVYLNLADQLLDFCPEKATQVRVEHSPAPRQRRQRGPEQHPPMPQFDLKARKELQ